MAKIKGELPFIRKGKKKNKKKSLEKKMKKQEKKFKMQCRCNHIASNDGKTHFKKVYENGKLIGRKCKICGEFLIADKSLLSKAAIMDAAQQFITLYGLARNKIKMGSTLYNDITKTLYMLKKAPLIVDELSGANRKKHNKKNNKKKNKGGKRGKRKIY